MDGNSSRPTGGPIFTFNEAVSFQVGCATRDEVDYYREALSAGGDPDAQQCGWLKDKYGVSWQIVPTVLPEMLQGSDPERADRVMQAVLQMKKIDIRTLQQAYQ
jgi:predicted 3-demethylubiquinone-9 3-methyltransferase (glyoxalase superfamily)